MCHDVKKFGRLHSGAKNVNSGCKPIRVPIPPLLCAGGVTLSKLVNGPETQFSHRQSGETAATFGRDEPQRIMLVPQTHLFTCVTLSRISCFLISYLFNLTVSVLTYGTQASLAAAHGLSSCSCCCCCCC